MFELMGYGILFLCFVVLLCALMVVWSYREQTIKAKTLIKQKDEQIAALSNKSQISLDFFERAVELKEASEAEVRRLKEICEDLECCNKYYAIDAAEYESTIKETKTAKQAILKLIGSMVAHQKTDRRNLLAMARDLNLFEGDKKKINALVSMVMEEAATHEV